jgi:hypothetical protein
MWGPACTFNLVAVVVFCFQSCWSLKDIFRRQRFYVDEIFCVAIWSRDLRLDLKQYKRLRLAMAQQIRSRVNFLATARDRAAALVLTSQKSP